jgi:CAAX prenyl protease-like protein
LTTSYPVSTWAFVLACVVAGALAVSVDSVTTPVSALVAGLLGFLGLWAWRWSRLPARIVEARPGIGRLGPTAASLGLGLLVGALLLITIRLIEPSFPAAGARIAAAAALPLWRRLVIIYVAAIGEELVFRLLLVSLLTGLVVRMIRGPDGVPNRRIIRGAIGVSALAFAAAHLPAWRAVGLRMGLVLAVLTLNGLAGLVFGYVFVKRGILAAMWAHAGADCVLQLIGPLTTARVS